jgi:Rhodanese-like domain
VKNRTTNARFAVFALAIVGLSIMMACQPVQLAPYTKYATDAEVPRISLEDAKKDFDNGVAVIIDARGDMQWAQEHIAGSMSSGKIGPVEQDYPDIPRGKKIIVYCS